MSFQFPLTDLYADEIHDPVGDLFTALSAGDVISFAGGIPDGSLFPEDELKASFLHVLTHEAHRALQYASSEGDPAMREQAALLTSRSLPTTPDQLQITSGSQEAIFLAARVMLNPGDAVLVERPTYLAAVQAFALAGARMVAVETDDDGVLPDALAAAIAEHDPKFLYLIPNFQNPTGRTMPLERREQVAEVLLRSHVALVEDDPYGDLRYDGERLPAIASLPGMATRTILLNSLSKVMAPGVRLGWLRAEGPILKAFAVAKGAVTMQSPALNQLAVAHYLANHDLAAHVRHVIGLYRERRDAMYSGLRAMLPPEVGVTRPDGGMFCWVTLGGDVDTKPLLEEAVAHGVAFAPGWSFYATDPDRSTMRLSFVTNAPDTIAEGLRRLDAVLQGR